MKTSILWDKKLNATYKESQNTRTLSRNKNLSLPSKGIDQSLPKNPKIPFIFPSNFHCLFHPTPTNTPIPHPHKCDPQVFENHPKLQKMEIIILDISPLSPSHSSLTSFQESKTTQTTPPQQFPTPIFRFFFTWPPKKGVFVG